MYEVINMEFTKEELDTLKKLVKAEIFSSEQALKLVEKDDEEDLKFYLMDLKEIEEKLNNNN
jgi:predicted lipid-binding transport protein (Tim44 family)